VPSRFFSLGRLRINSWRSSAIEGFWLNMLDGNRRRSVAIEEGKLKGLWK